MHHYIYELGKNGGIVARLFHHEHDVCIIVATRLFAERAAWVHQGRDTEQDTDFGQVKLSKNTASEHNKYPNLGTLGLSVY